MDNVPPPTPSKIPKQTPPFTEADLEDIQTNLFKSYSDNMIFPEPSVQNDSDKKKRARSIIQKIYNLINDTETVTQDTGNQIKNLVSKYFQDYYDYYYLLYYINIATTGLAMQLTGADSSAINTVGSNASVRAKKIEKLIKYLGHVNIYIENLVTKANKAGGYRRAKNISSKLTRRKLRKRRN